MDLSIVIPCYNEEDNIASLIKSIDQHQNSKLKYEVIFVDNGSVDRTSEKLENEIHQYNNFKLLKLDKNLGYGGGIIKGLSQTKGNILAWTHADIQTDPNDIFNMVLLNKDSLLKEKIVIKGNRRQRTFIDLFFTKMMSIFVYLFLSVKLEDINAQPKIFSRSLLKNILLGPNNFLLDLFLLIQSTKENYKIISIKNNLYKRKANKAKGGGTLMGKIKLSISTIKYIIKNRDMVRKWK